MKVIPWDDFASEIVSSGSSKEVKFNVPRTDIRDNIQTFLTFASIICTNTQDSPPVEAQLILTDPAAQTDGKLRPILIDRGRVAVTFYTTIELYDYIYFNGRQIIPSIFQKPVLLAKIINESDSDAIIELKGGGESIQYRSRD